MQRDGHQLVGQPTHGPGADPLRVPDDARTGLALLDDRVVDLYESLLGLGDPCRTILTALYLDPSKPSYADVAAATRRPIGSIGPTRARCLQRLRSMVDVAEAS